MEATDVTLEQEKRAKSNAERKRSNRIAFDKNTIRKKQDMIKALEKELGIVSPAADQARISRVTHYRWLKNDPNYKRKVEALSERTIDFVENSLMKSIKDGNVRAQIFYLNTKGKSRGYVPKTETEISGSQTQRFELVNINSLEDVSKLQNNDDPKDTPNADS